MINCNPFQLTMLLTLVLGIFLLGSGIGYLFEASWLKGSIFYTLGVVAAIIFGDELRGGKILNKIYRTILKDDFDN